MIVLLKNKKAVGFSVPTALMIENLKGSIHGRTSAAHHGHHAVNIQYGWIIHCHGNCFLIMIHCSIRNDESMSSKKKLIIFYQTGK
jgi:hypothetical protein